MKKLQLYNSLSNSLEDFVPIEKNNVRMYVCGPTVYASPHIGNARPMVIFDVLFRLLKKIYQKVTYVRNITDVDDKINARARERSIALEELTNEVIGELHKNMALLNLLPVSNEPRATFHIQEMLSIIQKLMDSGYAYASHGHILFRVRKMPNYGMLSKRSLDEMIAGSRVEVAPYKEDPMDFILWKPAEDGSPSWDSPFGAGRPGWHLECSAMSHKYLGEKFDIHAGGQDLMFPHHENELAQNYGAFGHLMANYWVHNGMLLADGQKMSKSLGNIISLDEILRQYDGEIVRYVLLGSHYQKTLNWNQQAISQAKRSLDRMYGALRLNNDEEQLEPEENDDDDKVLEALGSNLNTPLALHYLRQITEKIHEAGDPSVVRKLCRTLRRGAKLLGILERNCEDWFPISSGEEITECEIESLMEARRRAKNEKNFPLADQIRAQLLEKNIKIEDMKSGSIWSRK
ncbi:MAG: cysteine--tRNA ligase [Holosporaceae bacterium]|jgi:cysteinyl-tRNA synthetase|nr:cysteine--tRNA ligase [Holosporaceae bacterium]